MIQEVDDFCNPEVREKWTEVPHYQLIYNPTRQATASGLTLVSFKPESLDPKARKPIELLGLETKKGNTLKKDDNLKNLLSIALEVNQKSETSSAFMYGWLTIHGIGSGR